MICHKLSSLNPYFCRGKWDAGPNQFKPGRPELRSQLAALPAISKSTELPPSGQPPSFRRLCLVNLTACRAVRCVLAFAFLVVIPEGDLLLPLAFPQSHKIGASPKVSIHHLALDANPSTFYSLPIFDLLAPPANPVAFIKRTICAATLPRANSSKLSRLFGPAVNPASPDGGQHTT
jgi:hypothetical protein